MGKIENAPICFKKLRTWNMTNTIKNRTLGSLLIILFYILASVG